MATSMVWPPETSSTTTGHSMPGWSRRAANRWPSRWLTPTKGRSQASASALASATPTSSEPMRPRPDRRRHRVEVGGGVGDAGLGQGLGDDRGEQLEVGPAGDLGHDPAEGGVQVDLAGHDRRAHRRPAADHGGGGLVARGLDAEHGAGAEPRRHGALRSRRVTACSVARLDAVQAAGVVLGVDVACPHDDGVFVGLRVVVAAHPDRGEPEAPVQRLGGVVGRPHLEGEVAHAEARRRRGPGRGGARCRCRGGARAGRR